MISIIIPVYNLEDFIARTLESILAQTYKEIEIIVVNDGSIDKTGLIIDDFSNRFPGIIRAIHSVNMGVTNARLIGVSAAKGEWIGFCDGDDMVEPDMYERLLHNAEIYNADISHCGYRMEFEDGRINYFYDTGELVDDDRVAGLKDLLTNPLFEPGLWNKLFKKELFDKLFQTQEMDFSVKNNEDLLMNFLLFSYAKKSIFEDFCPYRYIVRQSSASRQALNNNKIYDPIKVKRHIVELAPEAIKREAKAAYLSTCIDVYSTLVCEQDKQFHKDRNTVRDLILDKKADARLLDNRRKLLVKLITYAPRLYPLLYRVYAKHFQEKKYD